MFTRTLNIKLCSTVIVKDPHHSSHASLHYLVNISIQKRTRKSARRAQSPPGAPPARNGSLDVIDHATIRFAICHFLWVHHCNRASISNRFWDIRPQHMFTNSQANKHDASQYLLL